MQLNDVLNWIDYEKKLFGGELIGLTKELSQRGRLKRLWYLIESDYWDVKLNLSRAANACCIEKNHLNVLLKRNIGMTFHSLLRRYRLLQAIHLMEEEDYNLLEISERVGFGSNRSFERNFKAILGVPPGKFRSFEAARPHQLSLPLAQS